MKPALVSGTVHLLSRRSGSSSAVQQQGCRGHVNATRVLPSAACRATREMSQSQLPRATRVVDAQLQPARGP